MPIRVKEWVQREWYNAGRDIYRSSGDFKDLEGLTPGSHLEIMRAPAWEAGIAYCADFKSIKAITYDHTNQRIVCIGQEKDDDYLASAYLDVTADPWTWSAVTVLRSSAINAGGVYPYNLFFWADKIWLIGSDGHVYNGASYTAALTDFYTSTNASLLCPCGGRMYLALTNGHIWRTNDGAGAFETYLALTGPTLNPIALIPYKNYLLLASRRDSGEIDLYRIYPDQVSPKLIPSATIPAARGDAQLSGYLGEASIVLHGDRLYITPGREKLLNGSIGCNVYVFNGAFVDTHVSYTFTNAGVIFWGLHSWRDRLMLYELGSGSQRFNLLTGRGWTTGIPTLSSIYYPPYFQCFVVAGELITLLTNTAGTTEYVYHLSHDNLADAVWTSSRWDMQSPAQPKRLEQITVLLDDMLSNAKVVIKYRTDDTGSWTTAATGNNTKRAVATHIGVTFYQLQLQITLDDDSGANKDYRIEAISVLYSIDT